jgi:hypothetical protein
MVVVLSTGERIVIQGEDLKAHVGLDDRLLYVGRYIFSDWSYVDPVATQ